ncbi:MAG TPA: hypothetical protein VFT10_05365 [Solirubrobacterales bacterium]|nr:hypothetical protein [Solirubrobacterales bacterium]
MLAYVAGGENELGWLHKPMRKWLARENHVKARRRANADRTARILKKAEITGRIDLKLVVRLQAIRVDFCIQRRIARRDAGNPLPVDHGRHC